MKTQNSFSHLTLEERRIILAGITNSSTKTAIAQTIGKDKSTVGKEIKLHRTLTHKCKMPLECNHYKKCVYGRQCTPDCPEEAHMDYRTTLIDSREGVNLTVQEEKQMAAVIAPLLKQGQSPYQIVIKHPELGISEKTLYNYIENDVFHEIAGITVLDLRRQVSRKLPKKKAKA